MFQLFVRMLRKKIITYITRGITSSAADALPQTAPASGSKGALKGAAPAMAASADPISAESAANRLLAFSHFTHHSRRYLDLLLAYLSGFVSVGYLKCNCYLILALTKTMESHRETIFSAQTLSGPEPPPPPPQQLKGDSPPAGRLGPWDRIRACVGASGDGRPKGRSMLKHVLLEEVS
jgi:hypothetical protein